MTDGSSMPPSGPENGALAKVYAEAVAYIRHVELDYHHIQGQLKQVETAYNELASYTRQLEQALEDHKQAAVDSNRYIGQLEADLATLRQSNDEGRVYAELLATQIRQLDLKLHDLEENLRQYQNG